MTPENLEVFCKNIECGDAGFHGGRSYRRMNYMGEYDLGRGMAGLARVFGNHKVLAGTHYFYECPICGDRRVYSQHRGVLVEVTKES
jgi:hypothetical protein